jgi:hypothetical protein
MFLLGVYRKLSETSAKKEREKRDFAFHRRNREEKRCVSGGFTIDGFFAGSFLLRCFGHALFLRWKAGTLKFQCIYLGESSVDGASNSYLTTDDSLILNHLIFRITSSETVRKISPGFSLPINGDDNRANKSQVLLTSLNLKTKTQKFYCLRSPDEDARKGFSKRVTDLI